MTSPLKAIRARCLDCCCFRAGEVRQCPSNDCPLHPFRFGRNPNRAGIGGVGNTRFSQKTPAHGAIADAQGAGAAIESTPVQRGEVQL